MLFQAALPLTGSPGQVGAGIATLPLALPSTPALEGVSIYAQAIVLDAGGVSNLAFSKGLEVTLCR